MKVVYIADIDNVDVAVAVCVLHRLNYLDYFVCSPKPNTVEGQSRLRYIKSLGVKVKKKLIGENKYVFVGTSLDLVSKYIKKGNSIDTLVVTGGFVGCNVYPIKLENGEDCKFAKSCNFNKDVEATKKVLCSEPYSINHIYLIGKNVYNSLKNTLSGLWANSDYSDIFSSLGVSPTKKQYGLLTVHEGTQLILNGKTKCEYTRVYPMIDCPDGEKTKWGSSLEPTEFREVLAAVRLK